MSIQAQINRIKGNVADAFDMVAAKGGTVLTRGSDNLAAAIGTIATVQAGDGVFALYINADGHLILVYETKEPPQFSLDSRGHLIYTYTEAALPLSINTGGHLIYTLGG